MKFFRWLLSNLIMIVIIVGLIYTYVYWGNLAGADTPAGRTIAYLSDEFVEVKQFVDGVKAKNKEKHSAGNSTVTASANHKLQNSPAEPAQPTADKNEQSVDSLQPSVNSTQVVVDNNSPVTGDKAAAVDKVQTEPAPTTMAESSQDSPAVIQQAGDESESRGQDPAVSTFDQQTVSSDAGSSDETDNDETGDIDAAAGESGDIATTESSATDVNQSGHSESEEVTDSTAQQPWQAEQQPVTISYSQNQSQQQDSSENTVSENAVQEAGNSEAAVEQDSAPVQLAQVKPDTFVTPEIEHELEQASADGGVAALTPEATRTVWIEARKSFYRRDYADSEKRYKRVISMTKDNYDAYGELGNVYFHQGKNDAAAEVYMKAAGILVRLGEVDRAHSLLGLMRYLDKDKATQLQQEIDATKKQQASTE